MSTPITTGPAAIARSQELAVALLDQLTEITGYPPEVLNLDADLQHDLSVRPEETLTLIEQMQHRLAAQCQPPAGRPPKTLRQVLEFLQSTADRSTAASEPEDANADQAAALQPSTLARRSILELVDAPWHGPPAPGFRPQGAVLLLGDNPTADVLRRRFEAQGATVHHPQASRGLEEVLAALERLPSEPAIRHVFILTGLDCAWNGVPTAEQWRTRREQGIELPLLSLQKWRQRLAPDQLAEPATIVAATRLGGDFGVAERVVAPEGGWVAGLLKALNVELNRRRQPVVVKVCDFSPLDTPDAIADALLRELAERSAEVEVALGGGQRRILRAVEQSADTLPCRPPRRGTTWLITGGARGVTAEVAIKLGLAYGLKLHLVGSSPAPEADAPWRNRSPEELKALKRAIVRQAIGEGKSPEKQWDRLKNSIEIDKNLQRMRQLGLDVSYHACDVSDWAGLGRVLDDVRRASGPIVGIVHGAGFAKTSRLELLKRENLTKTIDAKLSGALGLMQLTQQDPLAYFIGFGSISGRYGGNGLGDYAAANEMLAKLCAWFRTVRPTCATTCMQWQSWDEVGMAVQPDSSFGSRGVLKMKFMPTAEGVEHVCGELRAGLPQTEVLIDDGEFERLIGAGGE